MIFFLGGQTLLNESSVSTHIRREDESKNWMMAVFSGKFNSGATWIATSFQATLFDQILANIWARGLDFRTKLSWILAHQSIVTLFKKFQDCCLNKGLLLKNSFRRGEQEKFFSVFLWFQWSLMLQRLCVSP